MHRLSWLQAPWSNCWETKNDRRCPGWPIVQGLGYPIRRALRRAGSVGFALVLECSNKLINLPPQELAQQKQGHPKCSLQTLQKEPMGLQSSQMHSVREREQWVVDSSLCRHPTYQLRRDPSCLGWEQERPEQH